jgi:hypothetical protein
MNVQEIYEEALKDPKLLSQIDVNEIISKVDERQNAYLKNETLESVSKTIYDVLSDVENIEEDTVKQYFGKLKGYRYVDNLCDLRPGLYIRWISLGDSNINLTNGAFFQSSKIGETVNILCKNSRNRFFTIYYDDCIIFQKLSIEEEIILSLQK